MGKYTILFQGAPSISDLENIKKAKAFSDDVIVSTWNSPEYNQFCDECDKLGVRVLRVRDPGSVVAYTQGSVRKCLNLSRQIHGSLAGFSISKYDVTIRVRIDISLDFDLFYQKFIESGKDFAALNYTTICPTRLFGYEFYCHVSDWGHVGYTSNFLNKLSFYKSRDSDFLVQKVNSYRGIDWYSRLSAEQIYTLVLCGIPVDNIKLSNWMDSGGELKKYHEVALGKFINVTCDEVNLKNLKYKGKSIRWMRYKDAFFRDNTILCNEYLSFFRLCGMRLKNLVLNSLHLHSANK